MIAIEKAWQGYVLRRENGQYVHLYSGALVRFETEAEARAFAERHGWQVQPRRRCRVHDVSPGVFSSFVLVPHDCGHWLNANGVPRDPNAREPAALFLSSSDARMFAERHGWEVVQ